MDKIEERLEVTIKEIAAKYGISEATVDSALCECVTELHHPLVEVVPGKYRLTYGDLARIKSALSRD